MDALTSNWKSKWDHQTKILEEKGMGLQETGKAVHVNAEVGFARSGARPCPVWMARFTHPVLAASCPTLLV